MVITFYVQGSLLSVLTGPMYGPPITNIRQLKDSKLTLKITELIASLLQIQAKDNDEANMLLEIHEVLDNIDLNTFLDQLIKEKNFATFALSCKYTVYFKKN